MQAEKIIKEYQELKKELSELEFELSQFYGVDENEVIESLCYPHPEGERVQTSEVPDTTAKAALVYREKTEAMSGEWLHYLLERYQYVRTEIAFFEHSLKGLSGKPQEVIYDMVMERLTWMEIAKKQQVSVSMVGKYRKKAIKELDQMYAIRNRHVMDYILS